MPHFTFRSSRSWLVGAALLGLTLTVDGCALLRRPTSLFATPGPEAPTVLQPAATLNDVIAAVNANTMRVASYVTYDARISSNGIVNIPLLTANIAYERPRNFRLRGSTAITGPEIDLGSNDDEFWFWIRQSQPQAIYHCRHDQFANSPARDALPVEPQWIADALGLVYLDPTLPHEASLTPVDGKLEVRTKLYHPTGTRTRTTIIDATRAWVVEQILYDSRGQLIASSKASDFRYDPLTQVSLPKKVAIRVPSQSLSFTIDLGNVAINTYAGDAAMLWTRPTIANTPNYDLGGAAAPAAGTIAPPTPVREMPFPGQPLPVAPQQSPAAMPAVGFNAAAVDTSTAPAAPMVSRLPAGGIALPPR